jgi:hypothetical protein
LDESEGLGKSLLVFELYSWGGEIASGHKSVVLVRVVLGFEVVSELFLEKLVKLASLMVK